MANWKMLCGLTLMAVCGIVLSASMIGSSRRPKQLNNEVTKARQHVDAMLKDVSVSGEGVSDSSGTDQNTKNAKKGESDENKEKGSESDAMNREKAKAAISENVRGFQEIHSRMQDALQAVTQEGPSPASGGNLHRESALQEEVRQLKQELEQQRNLAGSSNQESSLKCADEMSEMGVNVESVRKEVPMNGLDLEKSIEDNEELFAEISKNAIWWRDSGDPHRVVPIDDIEDVAMDLLSKGSCKALEDFLGKQETEHGSPSTGESDEWSEGKAKGLGLITRLSWVSDDLLQTEDDAAGKPDMQTLLRRFYMEQQDANHAIDVHEKAKEWNPLDWAALLEFWLRKNLLPCASKETLACFGHTMYNLRSSLYTNECKGDYIPKDKKTMQCVHLNAYRQPSEDVESPLQHCLCREELSKVKNAVNELFYYVRRGHETAYPLWQHEGLLQLFEDRRRSRNVEYMSVLQWNLCHPDVDRIVAIAASEKEKEIISKLKLKNAEEKLEIVVSGLMLYQDAFKMAKANLEGKNVAILNGDILVSHGWHPLSQNLLQKDRAFALSRHEIIGDERSCCNSYVGCHDAFIFSSQFKDEVLDDFKWQQNVWRAENKVVDTLRHLEFKLGNPCSSLSTIHYHLNKFRPSQNHDAVELEHGSGTCAPTNSWSDVCADE